MQELLAFDALNAHIALTNHYFRNYSSHIPNRLPNQRQRRKLARQVGRYKKRR